jgi:geranylgeranyl diphosphate synthase type I
VVVPAALAMEYLHVATLVHDDIIDADDLRRARPTVHVAYGIPDAIVAGDHLIFAAFEAIAECAGHPIAPRALMAATAALATAGADLCRGQLLESRLAGDPTVDVSAYLTVAALKTGALFGAVCRVGAALGGGTAEQIDGLGRYGEELGIAFQIRDDLLACVLTAEATGKPATSDLANGRATLPVLFAYQAGDAAVRERLVALLRSGSASVPELAEFHGLLAGTGALTAARERAAQSGRIAMSALAPLGQSESVAALASVVRWAIGPET